MHHLHRGFHRIVQPRMLLALALLLSATSARAAAVFLRVRVTQPVLKEYTITAGGHRHANEPWSLPSQRIKVPGNDWSDWQDLSKWPWHGRASRAGGVAEWPSMSLSVQGGNQPAGLAGKGAPQ